MVASAVWWQNATFRVSSTTTQQESLLYAAQLLALTLIEDISKPLSVKLKPICLAET